MQISLKQLGSALERDMQSERESERGEREVVSHSRGGKEGVHAAKLSEQTTMETIPCKDSLQFSAVFSFSEK